VTAETDRLSTAQVDRLGERLRAAETIAEVDLLLLQKYRLEHGAALREVQEAITVALGGIAQTSRIKTIQTLHDKLRRQPTKLSRMQDIAGVRIVKDMDRIEQDAIVRDLGEAFPAAKIQDRRGMPSFGYRAVHVIVRRGRCSVEIQVRTRAQDLWAQIVERLGDVWGREIRYGGDPEDPDRVLGGRTRRELWALVQGWSDVIASIEDAIAEHNFAVAAGNDPSVRQFDPEDLRQRMHTGLGDLARFVDQVEGL
jgi:hypothetical protein